MDPYERLREEARLRQIYGAFGSDTYIDVKDLKIEQQARTIRYMKDHIYMLEQRLWSNDVYNLSVSREEVNKAKGIKANNMSGIVTFLKLDKDQRELNKAGILDDSGVLTEEGQEVLLNILIQSKEFKSIILEAAKEYNKGKKKKD